MAGIRVISTSTVHASNHSHDSIHTNPIELSPFDIKLLQLGPIQKGLLFHPNPKPNSHTLIKHLKLSLSKTLDFFPPLAGRLAIVEHQHDDDTGLGSTDTNTRYKCKDDFGGADADTGHKHRDVMTSFFIVCNNLGALFVEAMADKTTVADILESIYVPPIVHSFFPLNGFRNYEGTSKPLLGVQVTELVDGIFIGCTINHAVADGTSFWHFFNSWSEISRGLNQLSKPLVSLERWFPDGINRPICIPFPKKNQHQSVDCDCLITTAINEQSEKTRLQSKIPTNYICESQFKTIINSHGLNNQLAERIFHFTRKKIADLKAKANEFEASQNGISSLQSVLAHLWRSIVKNQRMDPQREIKYRLVAGVRLRLPSLPNNYFGNAVVSGVITMKASDILADGGFGKAAREMNKMVSSFTEEKIKNMLESWLKNPILPTESSVAEDSLLPSSSPRFDMYGNDFGWGKPVAVRSGTANKRYGKITLFSGAEEGGIDIEVCLPIGILEAMGNDPEFMDFVSL